MFIGIDTNTGNSSYLDIYIEGESQGWVAVGFTETPNMEYRVEKNSCLTAIIIVFIRCDSMQSQSKRDQ